MKITTNTCDLLIIDDRPVQIAFITILVFIGVLAQGLHMALAGEKTGLLLILLSLAFGIFVLPEKMQRQQVVFHRPEGWIELRKRSLRGMTKVRHQLGEIDRASVEDRPASRSGREYRVVLVIEEGQSVGRHPVTNFYSDKASNHRCVEAINRWLQDARQSDAAATKA